MDSLVPDSDTSRCALSGETKEAIDDPGSKSSSLKSHGEENLDHSLTAGDTHDSQPTTELLAGTDAPQQDAPAASMLTSQGVAMPSVEMLTAGKGEGVDKGEAKGNAVVEQVVADALAGGEGGKSIDALLDAITTRGHGGDKGANEALASHGQGDVSHWDTAGLAAFQTHAQFTMESIQLHHDAVQPAA